MSFWQNLANSYDQNVDALKKIYPLSTTTVSNNSDMIAIIVINENGKYIRSDRIEKANRKKGLDTEYITFPVTEESLGRSSNISPHPVFDQYGYLQGKSKKYKAYICQLRNFADSTFATEQIKAICKYVEQGSVAENLAEMKLKDKTNIVFQVEIPGVPQTKVWEDANFFNAWHQYYLDEKRKKAENKKSAEDKLTSKQKLSPDEKKKLKAKS